MKEVVAPLEYGMLKRDGTLVGLPFYGTTEAGEIRLGTNLFGMVNFYPSTFSEPALERFKKLVKKIFKDLRVTGVRQVSGTEETFILLKDGKYTFAILWHKLPRVTSNIRAT